MLNKSQQVEHINTELDIAERIELQEEGWFVQKIGWFLIFATVTAAVLGLFGDGILSKAEVISGDVTTSYEKLYRLETEMKILVESKSHISSISFDQEYLKDFRIVRFVPEPVNNITLQNEVQFNFLPQQNKIVSVYLVTKNYGRIKGELKINERDRINLNHFIFP